MLESTCEPQTQIQENFPGCLRRKVKVEKCPRIEWISKEIDLQAIASDDDFATAVNEVRKKLRAPIESATAWLTAAMKGEASCGRDRYGEKDTCHTCYISEYVDTTDAHVRYNNSDKGKRRLQAYRQKLKLQSKANTGAEKLTAKRTAQLLAALGRDASSIDLSCLSPKQEEVFVRYYGIGRSPMTMPAIAKELGCKKQNVAQLRDYALQQLKQQL